MGRAMKILVYTDGGKTSHRALRFAARWTAKLGADLTVATIRSETHAMESPPPLGREIPASEWDRLPEGLQVLAAAARQLAEEGLMPLPADITIRETPHSHMFACNAAQERKIGFHECFGSFIEALNREIDRYRYDLLIVAPPRRNRMRRMLLGDTTRKLALDLHASVLIVRDGGPESPPMVCTDGSASGKRAFPLLRQLLPVLPQPVTLCWVRPPGVDDAAVAQTDHCLSQATKWLESCGKTSRIMTLESDRPAEAIVAEAGTDSLLVVGASMRHDVYRRTRGSLPMRVLARTSASVLLSKAPPEAEPDTDEGRFVC
jgi:nucleotide-binding universal stress UspA family protein